MQPPAIALTPDAARLLDAAEIEWLRGITALAPLHMPGNLLGVELCRARFNCPQVRALICEPLGFLGMTLDPNANRDNRAWISAAGSKPVLRIAADEETMIRNLVEALLDSSLAPAS